MFIDILALSISGYIFIVPGLLLYFMYLKKSGKQQNSYHNVIAFVFCYYIIGILTMTGISSFKEFVPRIVLIPFVDMIRGPVDTILNVILFFPMGMFLPLLYKKYNCIGRIALTSFLLSLSIELIQMFGMGATDINDLITNVIGACLGYFVYKMFSKIFPIKLREKLQSDKIINDERELLFFLVYAFMIMVTIQPFIIHILFGPVK